MRSAARASAAITNESSAIERLFLTFSLGSNPRVCRSWNDLPPGARAIGSRLRSRLFPNIVKPFQPLCDDLTKSLQSGLVWDGPSVDAKSQQSVPRTDAVDSYLNTARRASVYHAEVVVDHRR